MDLNVLNNPLAVTSTVTSSAPQQLDRALLVRGLLDLAPNAWWVWEWVDAVVGVLIRQGYSEAVLAASAASLLERLRIDIEAERDRLAQAVFDDCVRLGMIEFRLRADAVDYEVPAGFELPLAGKPQPLIRPDHKVVEKSLFEPPLAALTDSGLERDVACYLDSKSALRWWHRNVAKAQYGLQGWKRHKVYPDFVFARTQSNGSTRLVVLETKGLHLAGSQDTAYKQALLQLLTGAFADERLGRAGEIELVGERESVVCDLVFEAAWEGSLDARHFDEAATVYCLL